MSTIKYDQIDPQKALNFTEVFCSYYKPTSISCYVMPSIRKVVFNNPATIVFWDDDTKTVVKCSNEVYDPEKGLAMAISKKALGNHGRYYETLKKWIPESKPLEE